MKYIKFLIINIIVFALLLFCISLVFPSQNALSKSVNLGAGREKCATYLSDSTHWKEWNSLRFQQEHNTGYNRVNTDSVIKIQYDNHRDLVTDIYEIYSADSLENILTWKKIERLPWYAPWKKFKAMVNNKQIAAEMESSLNSLKKNLEGSR
jgi:hypothetical protein